MTPKDILFTVVLPALVAAGCVLAGRSAGMSDRFRALRERLSVIAVAAAFLIGARFIVGAWPALPPAASEQWLFYLAAVACFASLALAAVIQGRARAPASIALCVLFGAAVVLLPLKAALNNQFASAGTRAAVSTLAAALIAAPMIAAARSAQHTTHAGTAVALLAAAAASAPGMFLSSSVKLAQLAGVLAVVAGVFAAAALLFRKWELSRGAAGTLAGLLGTLWAFAYFYASAPAATAILGALAPCAAAVSFVPAVRNRPRLCMVLQGLLALAIAGAATTVAFLIMPRDGDISG